MADFAPAARGNFLGSESAEGQARIPFFLVMNMAWDEENLANYHNRKRFNSLLMNTDDSIVTPIVEKYDENRILIEIPEKLVEEMKILGRHSCYLLYAEKPSSVMRIDGYTRLSLDEHLCYDVDEVKRLARAGRIPVMFLQRADQTKPSMKQVFTWWVTDNVLGYPVTHGLLSVDKGRVEFKFFNLKECFFCEKKSKPLKDLTVGEDDE